MRVFTLLEKAMYKKPFNSRFSRTPNRARRGRSFGDKIDPSRFINKAIITEEVERFIPEHSFDDFKIDERLKHSVIAKGYKEPTPIQDGVIPHILKNVDVLGLANTGT